MTKIEFDPEMIRNLAALLQETGLSEVELVNGKQSVRVSRGAAAGAAPAAPIAAAPMSAPMEETAPVDESTHPGLVTSPMVGTVYMAPEPGARPFISVGDRVQTGEPLLIVEAMKVMNQIPAPHSGRVSKIIARDATPVEFGEPLLIIE